MMQQYVLLRKENDLLNSLIGQSYNQKSKFEAYKILKQIHKQADQYSMEKALCYIVDKGEIKGVGGSSLMKDKKTGEIVSDLILDQFGEFMSGVFKFQSSTGLGKVLQDTQNVSKTMNVYAGGGFFNNVSINFLGVALFVGSGSTPPVRTDFFLETVFGTAPENAGFNPTTNPVWNSGLGNFKQNGAIIAGGAGTINESVLVERWSDFANSAFNATLFRDIISPGQSFIAGQTIALEYTIQL